MFLKVRFSISISGVLSSLAAKKREWDRWIGRGVNTVVGLLLGFFFVFLHIAVFADPLFLFSHLIIYITFTLGLLSTFYFGHICLGIAPSHLQTFFTLLLLHASRYAHPVHLLFPMFVHFAGAWLEVRELFPKSGVVVAHVLLLFLVHIFILPIQL